MKIDPPELPDWDAATYDRVADPQTRWGRAVLDRLPLAGDEVVLDAGCGSGRVTELLLARLPHGRVVALDASQAMLVEARRRLELAADRLRRSGHGGQVQFVQADLARPLPLAAPVDAILSTATFHWVLDHDALFANLAAVLRPGGLLVAQCGGVGNVARLEAAVPEMGSRAGAVNFATPEATRARLEAVGFEDVRAWLQPELTRFDSDEEFEAFLRVVCLRTPLARLGDEAERARFVREVTGRLPEREIDYVRLNIVARRRLA